MTIQSPRYRPSLAFVVLAILLLTSLACSFGGVTLGKDSAIVDATLNQDQVNEVFKNLSTTNSSSSRPGQLMDAVTGIEMHNGYMRVLGEDKRIDGSSLKCSYDVAIRAVNNQLEARIITVNIPGVSMDNELVTESNQILKDILSTSVNNTIGDAKLLEATVTEGALKLKLQVNYQKTKSP